MWKVCDNQILMSNVQIMDLYNKGCYFRLNNKNGKFQLISFKFNLVKDLIISLFPWQASLSMIDLTWSPQTKIRIVFAIDLNSWLEPLSPGLVPVSGVVMTWKTQESRQGWHVTTRNTITHSYDEITTISTRLVAMKLMIHQILQRLVI